MNAPEQIPLGRIPDMPADVYHSTMALSAGGLKRLRESPLHFWSAQLDPEREHGEPTAAMRAGTLAHTVILEPDEVWNRYVQVPADAPKRPTDVQRNAAKPSDATKAAIAWWDAFDAANKGLEVVTAEEIAKAERQRDAVMQLPEIASFLRSGRAEVSAFGHDPETGVYCKCRPDWEHDAGPGVVLLDLKTCPDASPQGFSRQAFNLGYHLQDAWYRKVYEEVTGRMVLGFVFVAVEHERPHACAAYMFDDASLEKARAKNAELTRLYAECLRTNTWPGYANTITPISLPAWAS